MRINNKYPLRLINHRFNLIVYSSKSNPGVIIAILLMSLVMQCILLRLQLAYLIRVLHGAGGCVTLILLKGVCLSMHSPNSVVNPCTIWSGESKPYTTDRDRLAPV